MVLDKQIALVGYSGHGYVVADAAISLGMNLSYYVDKEKNKNDPFNLNYLGFEKDIDFFSKITNVDFILGIGNNKIREEAFRLLLNYKLDVINVIHSTSLISQKVSLGQGNFLSKNVIINPLTKIKDACIINTGAIIEHECNIENAVHIAPGAVLAGNVTVGHRSFVGANSVVKEGVKIGDNVIIGAGSVVVKDIPNNAIVFGNPINF